MKNIKHASYEAIWKSKENNIALRENRECNRYDSMIAVACGAVGGILDIFGIDAPGKGVLGKWTDKQVSLAVMKFAKSVGWNPRAGKTDNLASAVGFLEKKFKVNYDQRHTQDVGSSFPMSSLNHHIVSFSHSPDIFGLFFSVLNQFTSTSSFISDGKIIHINTESFELEGSDFLSKLYSGVVNWMGHIMSDIAGSSGSIGNGGRGCGIVIPFYEFFRFCKIGKLNVRNRKQDLATIATRVFEEGYDFRHGLAISIPVIITELLIRLAWAIRSRFLDRVPCKDCIPTKIYEDLRVMLLLGDGTICAFDGLHAIAKSNGDILVFCTRLNLVAWLRFISLVFKEVCIRIGIPEDLSHNLYIYKEINRALDECTAELEQLSIEYSREYESNERLRKTLSSAKTSSDLQSCLMMWYQTEEKELPWTGDFNSFMKNRNNSLFFRKK